MACSVRMPLPTSTGIFTAWIDAMDHLGIHAIFESAVEVDDVEIFRPEGFPLECHFYRIIAIDGEVADLALL